MAEWSERADQLLFNEAKNEQTDRDLSNSPKHLAKLNVTIPLLNERIFVGTELQYMSNRKNSRWQESR